MVNFKSGLIEMRINYRNAFELSYYLDNKVEKQFFHLQLFYTNLDQHASKKYCSPLY
jgi:hypothetical protein